MRDMIINIMNEYTEAMRSLDAGRIASFYAEDPDFRMYLDGNAVNREELVALVTALCSSVKELDATWGPIEVTPLGEDAALAAGRFQRTLVDESGESTDDWGSATWVWIRRDGNWRAIHAHGVHYPGKLPEGGAV